MYKLNNKFAIGCLVQWYEIEIVEEYVKSVKKTLEVIENKENVIVDFKLVINQNLEKIDESQVSMDEIITRFEKMIDGFELDVTEELVTIADYRRWFNDYYCDKVDVLMWGETDSILPKQTFEILDNLHTQAKETTPKYVSFFGICKMWDDSWKILEHPDFTDKPFIDNDYENWWSLKYTMSADEMYEINEKVEDLDVRVLNEFKFNGCGLVISSALVKAGVNIPRSVFFVHEDTAFQNVMIRLFGNSIPQYVIKNVLLVHNRNHPKKRMYIRGEREDGTMNEKRRSNDWYVKANQMCEHNAYNLFNQSKTYTWNDVFENKKSKEGILMKILITGGTGFQGSNLSKSLLDDGHDVVILNLNSEKNETNVKRFGLEKAKIIWGSINDIFTVKESMRDVDLVVHTAAKIHVDDSIKNPNDYFETNVMGTNNVLEVARQFNVPVIHVSTCEVYGFQDEDLLETSPLMPRSPYAASKAGADRMAYSYYTTYDMNVCIIRPFNVFGPGQKDGKCGAVIPIWTTSLLEGKDITIYGEGTQSREFIYIDDLVSAYKIIIDKMLTGKELAGEVINVGTGVDVKVHDLAETMVNKIDGNG